MKKMIIMAGLPGSGKSYIREKMFNNIPAIDCDEIKKSIKGYDPKNPGAVHAESKMLEKKYLYDMLITGEDFVYDTTASNSDSIIKLTKEAQSIGYEVELVYVKTTLATALDRNAKRERVVPESIILQKYEVITTSIKVITKFVNKVTVVEND